MSINYRQIDCSSAERVKAASLQHGPNGEMFDCTVSRMTKQAASALDDALYAHAPVELMFADSSLFLDVEALESREAHTIRIVGRVIGERMH